MFGSGCWQAQLAERRYSANVIPINITYSSTRLREREERSWGTVTEERRDERKGEQERRLPTLTPWLMLFCTDWEMPQRGYSTTTGDTETWQYFLFSENRSAAAKHCRPWTMKAHQWEIKIQQQHTYKLFRLLCPFILISLKFLTKKINTKTKTHFNDPKKVAKIK